jgi:AraC-like DNA-binding protein
MRPQNVSGHQTTFNTCSSRHTVLQRLDSPRNRLCLLRYPQGDRLRVIARLYDPGRGTAKALAWLRANYTKPFRLDRLATVARMGISTLNHHFRDATSLSPLQSQAASIDGCTRKKCSSQEWMPPGPLARSDIEAPASSLANTSASSVNRRCGMSIRSDRPAR